MNARHEPLGEAQVVAALMAASAGPAELLAQLSRQLDQHVGDRPAHDDVTVLCLAAVARSRDLRRTKAANATRKSGSAWGTSSARKPWA